MEQTILSFPKQSLPERSGAYLPLQALLPSSSNVKDSGPFCPLEI